MRAALATCLVLGACRYYPLDEVPIVGATPEQEEAIRAELLAFDEAVGPGRTRVGAIWIADIKAGRAGQFRAGTRRITLDAEDGLDRLTLTHELCHALDADEALWRDPLMEELAEGLFSDGYAYAPDDPNSKRSARTRQGEAFASFCETGAVAAFAIQSPCEGDPPEARRIGSWYHREVWSAMEAEDLRPPTFVNAPLEPVLGVVPTTDPEVIALLHPSGVSYASLHTGTFTDLRPEPIETGRGEAPPGLVGSYVGAAPVASSPAGAFGAGVHWWLHQLGYTEPRFLAYQEDSWHIERGACAMRGNALFPADGGVWIFDETGWGELAH